MKPLSIIILLIANLFLNAGCKSKTQESNRISATKSNNDWINLLSDDYRNDWRGYNGKTLPPGWSITNDMLWFNTNVVLEQDYTGGKDIIFANREFEHFELVVDWKIPEGGNSGIFYHIKEGYDSPPQVSPEYQLIDDVNYARLHDLVAYNKLFGASQPELLQDWQKTGADYAMHVANEKIKKLNPVGEWNTARIVVGPDSTEHWLNGVKLLSFKPWSEDWYQKKNSGKWDKTPDYGKFKTGYIGFQDHGSPLWFKNIKIRPL